MPKVIYNKLIPFKGFYAITILEWIFVRKQYESLHESKYYFRMLNHESVHIRQERELGYVLFYIIYLIEWIIRLISCRFDASKAYRSISFEAEAYAHESDPDYCSKRKCFAQWRKK